MTAKTQPMSAAEARALADQLTAAERDLDTRRREARKAAEIQTCRDILGEPAAQLAAASSAAREAWNQAILDTSVGIDDLFELWQQMRLTSAARAQHVAQASATWDRLEPLRNPMSGQPDTHRADTHDYMEPRGQLAFSAALEEVLARRAAAAAAASDRVVLAALAEAGDTAAGAVK